MKKISKFDTEKTRNHGVKKFPRRERRQLLLAPTISTFSVAGPFRCSVSPLMGSMLIYFRHARFCSHARRGSFRMFGFAPDRLHAGIYIRYARFDPHARPTHLALWLTTGTGLRFLLNVARERRSILTLPLQGECAQA